MTDLAPSAPAFMPHAPPGPGRAPSLRPVKRGQGAMNSPPNSRKGSPDDEAGATSDPARARDAGDLISGVHAGLCPDHAHLRCETVSTGDGTAFRAVAADNHPELQG